MLKKLISYLLIILTIVTILNGRAFDIEAEPNSGSITIDIIHQEDVDGNRIDTPIPGIEFDVYQVWTYDMADKENIKIKFKDSFDNITQIDASMSEDEIQKKASLFAQNADESNKLFTVGPTDSNGQIVINDLEIGVYLFIMEGTVPYNGALYQIAPFMVSIPRKTLDGDWIYDVNAFPKPGIVKDEPPLDKTVNGEKQYQLKVDYEVFTYNLKTAMPKLADEFEIYDTLQDVLEFAPYESLDELIEVIIGGKKLSLEELEKQVKIEGQKLTVVFTKQQLQDHKEEEVVINFGAKIRQGADLSKYVEKKVPNDCEYKLNNTFKKSDKVYVTPPPPPWNPPKTGILIIDTIVGNPWYFASFILLILLFIFETLRKYRKENN